jgi:hypothetical protein
MGLLFLLSLLLLAIITSALFTALLWAIPPFRQLIQPDGQFRPSHSDDLFDALDALVESERCFRIEWGPSVKSLFETLKALVEANPSHAAAIVLAFEPRLSQLRRDSFDFGGDVWRMFHGAEEDWIQHIMRVAPVSWLKDLWQEADHKRDQIWLFELIIRNKVKPISLHEDESPNRIFIECEQKIFLLRDSDKEYNTMRRISNILLTNDVRKWTTDPNDKVNSFLEAKEFRRWTRYPNDKVNSNQVSGRGPEPLGALIYRNIELIAPKETGYEIPAL